MILVRLLINDFNEMQILFDIAKMELLVKYVLKTCIIHAFCTLSNFWMPNWYSLFLSIWLSISNSLSDWQLLNLQPPTVCYLELGETDHFPTQTFDLCAICSVCLSACLSVCVSVCLYVCLSMVCGNALWKNYALWKHFTKCLKFATNLTHFEIFYNVR